MLLSSYSSVSFVLFVSLLVLALLSGSTYAGVAFTGVNLSGGEFGSQPTGSGTYGTTPTNYIFPDDASMNYWLGRNVTVVRLPFFWERLQQTAKAALDTTYLGYIQTVVTKITASKVNVVLDAHSVNGAWYLGSNLSPSSTPSYADFGDFWGKVATVFKDNAYVWFGLINEPHNIDTSIWVGAANAAIAAIRQTGATNRIMVCGNSWSGVHSWFNVYNGVTNAVGMLNVTDSGDNLVIEVHQYFDGDYSGTNSDCSNNNVDNIFQPFTTWARNNNKKAFLGEFGGPNTATCQSQIKAALDHMAANTDVYIGWTWWVAGKAWSYYSGLGNAGLYSIEPSSYDSDKPQFAWLQPYFSLNTGSSGGGGGGSGGDGSTSGSAGGSSSSSDRLLPSSWYSAEML